MNNFTENSEDRQLWSGLKRSNEKAFAILYRRYVSVLYSYGKKIIRKDEIVEDAIQDLFIDLWQMREKLSDVETARFYLFRSLRRKIHREYLMKSMPLKEWEDADEKDLSMSYSLEEEIIALEIARSEKENIEGLLKQLPPRQAEAIMLYYYENFTFNQVSELLGINEQSARNLIQRALDKLRRLTTFLMPLLMVFI